MSEIRKNVFNILSGSMIGQLIIFAMTPMLTRSFTPEILGSYALFTSCYSLLAGIATLRFEVSIPYPKSVHMARRMSVLTLGCAFIFALITLFVIANVNLWGPLSIPNYFYILPAAIVIITFQVICQQWMARKSEYARYSKGLVINSLVYMTIVLAFIFYGTPTIYTLVGGFVGGLFISTLYMLGDDNVKIRKIFSHARPLISSDKLCGLFRRHLDYPRYLLPSFALSMLASNAPIFILNAFKSATEVGFFSVLLRLILTPGIIIGAAMSEALKAEFFKRKRHNKSLMGLVLPILLWGVLLGVGGVLFCYLWGSELALLILGEKFANAVYLIFPLSVVVFSFVIFQPFQILYVVMDKKNLNFWVQFILAIIPNSVLLMVSAIGYSLHIAIWSYALTLLLCVMIIMYSLYILLRSYDRNLMDS